MSIISEGTTILYLNGVFQEYERGLKCIRILLKSEPGNTQALDLETLIKKAMRKGELSMGLWL